MNKSNSALAASVALAIGDMSNKNNGTLLTGFRSDANDLATIKAEIEAKFTELDGQVVDLLAKTNEEVEAHGSIGRQNQEAITETSGKIEEILARLMEVEQAGGGDPGDAEVVSAGMEFVNSEQFKTFASGESNKARMEIQANTITGTDTTVAPERREGVVPGATRRLRIAEVMPGVPCSGNAIEYVKESAFTDNAAEQSAEGSEFAESDLSFSLINTPVRTIGHFILVSRQMMDDGPAIAGYVNTRLAYGVLRRLDTQLISGDGTAGDLSGILDAGNFTEFGAVTGEGLIGNLRKAITDLELADYFPNAVILNPAEVELIDLTTTTAGDYVAANPRTASAPQIWGLPIVSSNSMPVGNFAMGAFDMATILHNRQGAVLEASESDEDNFRKNLVTLKATVRAALEVNTPAAIIGGAITL